ncbi:GNAT family N-acetyltransferase [Flexivirga sp. B27]
MMPKATARLRFREMAEDDLDAMSALLGDPEVMRFYPRSKTRDEALAWIRWNQHNYADHGFGLWIVETHDGRFVGDCGLTWQLVEGEQILEVGYHTVTDLQGHGYATEAARACAALAFGPIGSTHLVAIIKAANVPSQRVAEKIGLRLERTAEVHGGPVVIYGSDAPEFA